MPRLTEEQRAERATGLGATDLVTAAGLGYNTAFELYLEKIGELDPDARVDDASRGRMERGHRLEDVALKWDVDEHGGRFERVNRTVWHPTLPFLYCHPDATRGRFGRLDHLVEVKTSKYRWREVTRATEVQVQVQMACTGAQRCDVVVLTFDGPPTRFTVERDEELIRALEELATTFWDRVQRRDPPPMDGSPGASRWLDRTRWRDEPELIANQDQRALVDRLLELRRASKLLLDEDAKLVNDIKLTMGGSSRLDAGSATVIWTAPTTTHTVAWKEVAAAYRRKLDEVGLAGDADTIESLYGKDRESRSFIVRDHGEE